MKQKFIYQQKIRNLTIDLKQLWNQLILKKIEFDDPDYSYQKQGEMLHKIIHNHSEYLKYKSFIQKRTTLQIENTKLFTESEYTQLIKQFIL